MGKVIDYFKFISKQLGHMQLSSYCLWSFSLGVQLMILLSAPITPLSVISFIGTSLGVLCVIAISAARSVNGWLGIISAICFIIIGFSAKNYLSIGEQLAYIATLDIPVLISTDWNQGVTSKMRNFNAKSWTIAIGFTVAVWLISSISVARLTNDPRPFIDGLSFAVCLTGGLVCTLRYNNQYFWWTFGGLMQIILWFVTLKQGGASPAMLVNSLIYFANDILAFTVSPWYSKKQRALTMKQDQELFGKNTDN